MYLNFKSIDGLNNEINYQAEYKKENNKYIFNDQVDDNTIIILEIDNIITFKRIGNTNMLLILDINNITNGFYSNIKGLEFNFSCKTNYISFNNDELFVDYELFIDNELINTQKIWINFK